MISELIGHRSQSQGFWFSHPCSRPLLLSTGHRSILQAYRPIPAAAVGPSIALYKVEVAIGLVPM